jgi:mannose-6-phosphate isomerase-like protein (cupin superfamily)
MHISSKSEIKNPLETAHGEIIFELVGRPHEHGGAFKHSLAHVVIPPGKASLMHYHLESEESYYILEGTAQMVVNGETLTLSPGQTVLIQPKETHQILNNADTDLEFLVTCAPAWVPEDSYYDV